MTEAEKRQVIEILKQNKTKNREKGKRIYIFLPPTKLTKIKFKATEIW